MPRDPRIGLGPDAEEESLRLLDGYQLGDGFDLALVVSEAPPFRDEVRARLAEVGPLYRVEPGPRIARELAYAAPGDRAERPIYWVEQAEFDPDEWSAALDQLNWVRDRLTLEAPGLLVLAGPPELAHLAFERPDLGSKVSTVVRGDAVTVVRPGRLGWLHLSDLHFDGRGSWHRRKVLARLLDFLAEHVVGAGHPTDLVFVTGDIAQRGKAAEYEQAEGFLRDLMDVLRLDIQRRLFLVPGNHDVDRDRGGVPAEAVARMARDARGAEEVARVLGEPAVADILGARVEAFCDFTGHLLGPARRWPPERPWRTEVVRVGHTRVRIVQLNSALLSGADDERGKLMLSEDHVLAALAVQPDADLTVALLHHPTDWLTEDDRRAVEGALLGRYGVDVLLRGHLHDPEAMVTVDPDGHVLSLAAGAAYTGGPWPLGCLHTTLDPGRSYGEVRFYAYSERRGGFWHPDSGAYPGAKGGVWPCPLPRSWREPGRVEPVTDGARPAPYATRVSRYRAVAGRVHGAMSFIGLPDGAAGPGAARVTDLFVPVPARPSPRVTRPAQATEPVVFSELVATLLDVDHRERAGRLVVLGGPGSGKSTVTRYLAVWASGGVELEGVARRRERIPLRIALRELGGLSALGDGVDLLDVFARQSATVLQLPFDRAFFERALSAGDAIVLFDGLDEVPLPRDRERIRDVVHAFAAAWPRAPILVTSRVAGYDVAALNEASNPDPFVVARDEPRPFLRLTLDPLTEGGLEALVRKWYRVQWPHDARLASERAAELLGALRATPAARELASNPLLATLICLIHRRRVRLPGQRARLYELVVDTMLATWDEAKGAAAGFTEIPAHLQRRYLEALALEVVEEWIAAYQVALDAHATRNAAGQLTIAASQVPGATELPHDHLVAKLVAIVSESGDDPRAIRGRIERWLTWLASRTGILVEVQPAVFGFFHRSLGEYLAACALSEREGAHGLEALVELLHDRSFAAGWEEVVRLVIGLRASDPAFAEALARRLLAERTRPELAVVLLEGVREGLVADDAVLRQALVRALAIFEGYPWMSDMTSLAGDLWLTLAHSPDPPGQAVRDITFDLFQHWSAPLLPDSALLRVLPDLLGDGGRALEVLRHLRRQCHIEDGTALYDFWSTVEWAERRYPDVAADLATLRTHLFDDLPEPTAELFEPLRTASDGERPYWCEVPWPSDPGPTSAPRAVRVGAAPITVAQFRAFDPLYHRDDDDEASDPGSLPARVLYHEAVSFCRWLAARAPWAAGARLPTLAEWRHAARGGAPADWPYWSGPDEEALARVGWFLGNSGDRLHRVAEKPSGYNPFGLYDVHGNVWEFVTVPGDDDVGEATSRSPTVAVTGGAWRSPATECALDTDHPAGTEAYTAALYWATGFRVVIPGPAR